MKTKPRFTLFLIILLLSSCIVQFIPETDEDQELLVVEGLITDQPGPYTILLSKSLPLGKENIERPLIGCSVSISDDLGNYYSLTEGPDGTYLTDSADFRGIIGRKYSLHINTNWAFNNLNYESLPMELNAVPPIDTVYYERVTIFEGERIGERLEGCQVFLNSYDPTQSCKFYRWEYSETWEFRLPYSAPENNVCWLSENSDRINIKNTSVLEEDRITRYPLNYITNTSDRLKIKYSMMVDQYSLNEEEYLYWEKLQTLSESVGGLYDITPAAIPSNIWCIDDPNNKVLGYFSVSAKSSKRIFIDDVFLGIINLYQDCISDTIYGRDPIEGLGERLWLLEEIEDEQYYRIVTKYENCADCTLRGTNIEPLFWKDDNK